MLQVKVITDEQRAEYETFLAKPAHFDHLTFFHTWEWGELIKSRTYGFERVGIYDGETLVAVGQVGLQKFKLGSFWYCPRGLVLDYADTALVGQAYDVLRSYFRGKSGAAWLRVDPDIVREDLAEVAVDDLHPKQAYIFTQAERVWLVDLQKDEESLVAWMKENGMRKNVAYYLRRAAKEGVKVRASDKPEDLEILIDLLHKMSDRKGGVGMYSDEYYRKQFALMAPKGYEKVFIAEKNGQVLAAALVGIYGKEGSYLHAASSDIERQLSAPHFLLFEVMKYLQKHHPDMRHFNFWGVVSDKNRHTNHPRYGYSKFKRSFGGYKLEYIRARDFVYNPFRWLLAYQLDRYRTWKNKND